jgi:hypothetical protein
MGDERTNKRARLRPPVSFALFTKRDVRGLYREGVL